MSSFLGRGAQHEGLGIGFGGWTRTSDTAFKAPWLASLPTPKKRSNGSRSQNRTGPMSCPQNRRLAIESERLRNHRNPLRTSPGPRQRRTRKPKARKSWWTTRESNSPHAPCKGASPPRNMRSHEFDGGYLRESNAAPPARKGCRTSSYTKAPHHRIS